MDSYDWEVACYIFVRSAGESQSFAVEGRDGDLSSAAVEIVEHSAAVVLVHYHFFDLGGNRSSRTWDIYYIVAVVVAVAVAGKTGV